MSKKSKKSKAESPVVDKAPVEKLAVEKAAAGPALRWLVCEDGDIHVFGPCPHCSESRGGMLMGSTLAECRGIARATCTECGQTTDYFVDTQRQQIWRAEAIPQPAHGK